MLLYMSTGLRPYGSQNYPVSVRRVWEFQAVVKGWCGPILPDTKPELSRKRLWVFHPQCPHGWSGKPGSQCRIAVFHFSDVPAPLDEVVPANGMLSTELSPSAARRIMNLERQLRPHRDQREVSSALIVQRALLDLSLMVISNAGPLPPIAPREFAMRRVDTALAWYAEHLAETPSLERVSETAGVSSRQMRRHFWMVRRQSPAQAFRQAKMQRVRELLASTDMTAARVANTCGFGSESDFSRAFKAYHGETPTHWRRRSRPPYFGT